MVINQHYIDNSCSLQYKEGDLVSIYSDSDAEGHRYYKKVGVILGVVKNPSSYMQFYTYRIFLGNKVARVHEVWIKKIESRKGQDETL